MEGGCQKVFECFRISARRKNKQLKIIRQDDV